VAGSRQNIHISSSIENWREKIEKKLVGYRGKRTLFFGAYHEKDYDRILKTEGPKSIYWQGSDIKQLPDTIAISFTYLDIKHYCENNVCQSALKSLGIKAEIKPIFWGDINKYPLSYKPSENPQIWLCAHPGREREYGVEQVYLWAQLFPFIFHIYGVDKTYDLENVIFHGIVSEKELDGDIKNYQCGLRYNEFDGFSEVVSKSMLLGQHVISRIDYPHSMFPTYKAFSELKNKKANTGGREYYLKLFKNQWT
jgi:hypothetical protein